MKLRFALFGVSVLSNVALLGWLTRSAFLKPAGDLSPQPASSVSTAMASAIAAEAWNELQPGDLAAQVERLRAEKFPPEIIRAIMAGKLRERFAGRRAALEGRSEDAPYWLPELDRTRQAAQRALQIEQQKALDELLGPDPQTGEPASLRRLMPQLLPEKIEALAQIKSRYDEQRRELYGSRPQLAEDYEKIDALEKAMRAEFATVLTPSELEDYELRTSRTASQLRYNLAAFDATEQEYRAIFKLQSAFDEQYSRMRPGISREEMSSRGRGEVELKNQIAAALGPERYADYERATNYNYKRTTQLVARLNLPPETADELYAMQQSTQALANTMPRSSGVNREAGASLAALKAETEAKIAEKLGSEGLAAYKEYAGSWLSSIGVRARPAPKK